LGVRELAAWWRGMSRRRRALVTAITVLAVVGVTAAVVQGLRGPTAVVAAQQRPGVVLLVPGYGGGTGSLSVLAGRLRAGGRTAEVVPLPGDGTGDLRAQMLQLDRVVGDALARGAPSVDLIGYSAGGVVVRLWVANSERVAAARRVVTLGSPLHGARIAATGGALVPQACPLACQQLAPGSALLSELDRQPLPPNLPWLSIWTEDDQTVIPPDSARLDGAVNVPLQRVCHGVRISHSQLPTDPLVTGLVRRALGTGPLTAPSPADCATLRTDGR
jgi:triacylglycerol lipase